MPATRTINNNNNTNNNDNNNNRKSNRRSRNASITSSPQTFSSLNLLIVMIVGANCLLTAEAIRCHQCNSHLDEDCITLRLATPRAPRDDQFLKECEGAHSAEAFCRKTVTTLEISGEKRIVRSCGWHKTDLKGRNDTCFEADNEGFMAEICACFQDGCNAATSLYRHDSRLIEIGVAIAIACGVLLLPSMNYRRGG